MRTFALLAAATAALCSVSAFGQYTVYQNTPITIPAVGAVPASVYPSTLNVSPTLFPYVTATKVTVTIHGFSHTWPDDVDIMLRNPSYNRTIMLMSDVGGSTDAANLTITFDPTAAAVLPDNGALTSGVFRPTDAEPGESVLAPAPAAPYGTLASLQGIIPFNGWELYVVDDNDQDGGSIAAWSLNIYPANDNVAFASNSGDTVPPIGPALTYPMTINVYGVEGPAQYIGTNIRLAHNYPADLDILLVAPDGTSCILMSDAGGTTATAYTEIAWRAPIVGTGNPIPAPLPSIVVGALPTNIGAGDTWPAPAPLGPYGDSMTPFLTANLNGTWKLFVYDDESPDGGDIGYWSIQINGRTFCAGDFNKSGAVSVQDIFDFLAAYFAGCP